MTTKQLVISSVARKKFLLWSLIKLKSIKLESIKLESIKLESIKLESIKL